MGLLRYGPAEAFYIDKKCMIIHFMQLIALLNVAVMRFGLDGISATSDAPEDASGLHCHASCSRAEKFISSFETTWPGVVFSLCQRTGGLAIWARAEPTLIIAAYLSISDLCLAVEGITRFFCCFFPSLFRIFSRETAAISLLILGKGQRKINTCFQAVYEGA